MKVLNFMVLQNINMGQVVGLDLNLGGVRPARTEDPKLGVARRDILAGETIEVGQSVDTKDVFITVDSVSNIPPGVF